MKRLEISMAVDRQAESSSGISNTSLTSLLETDVGKVLHMSTQKVEPDPGSLDQQQTRGLWSFRKKIGAFAVAAAIGLGACSGSGDAAPVENATTPADEAPAETVPDGTVTFDGSTCSIEITADWIEPGLVNFNVFNTADQSVMFDSWELLEGYTFGEFESVIERTRRLLENGKPYPTPGFFPDQETQVRYLRSDVIPANSSGHIVTTMSAGTHAIVCLQRVEGAHRSLRGRQSFGISGPIGVG